MNLDRTWLIRKTIPQKYHKASGLSEYVFQVCEPWHKPFRFAENPNGKIVEVEKIAKCLFRAANGFVPVYVSSGVSPKLYQAVLAYGAYLFTGGRVERYLALYKSYETLVPHASEDFTMVRHGITHAPSALTRPKTVAALNRLFGSTEINLDNYSHQRVFFGQLATLLMKTDTLVAAELAKNLTVLSGIRYKRLLHDWQVSTAEN